MQVVLGMVLWMMYTRDILVFQRATRARTDWYSVLMALPLTFVLLYYGSQQADRFFAPVTWSMPALFLFSNGLVGLNLWIRADIAPPLKAEIRNVWVRSVALAVFFALVAFGFHLYPVPDAALVAPLRCVPACTAPYDLNGVRGSRN